MNKPNLIACLVVLLTFSVPALAQAPGGGAPGSTGYPGGGAPGANASSSGTAAAASSDGGLGKAAEERGGPEGGPQGGPPPELPPEKLAEIKTKILAHMDENIAEIQKRKACVQAAATGLALKACMPERRGPGGPQQEK